MTSADDAYDLHRFVEAQERDYPGTAERSYDLALAELADGRKRSHWMWYVFPQLEGLGSSPAAVRYSIRSLAEAEAYLDHPILGPRLRECAEAALLVDGWSAHDIFGSPDDWKLRSCATLFALVSPAGSVFHRLLERFFQGEPDPNTLRLLGLGSWPSTDA